MKKVYAPAFAALLLALSAQAQWSTNPQIADTKICTATGDQWLSRMITDGNGGAIAFWFMYSGVGSVQAFYNRINSAGTLAWAAATTGLPLASSGYFIESAVSDGAGGACVSLSNNDGDIYLQRITGAGTKAWAGNGVLLSAANSYGSRICSDGSGGAIVTWTIEDDNNAVDDDRVAYAQRVDASGNKLWGVGGVQVVQAGYNEPFGIMADGSGGAVIALSDQRNATYDAVNGEWTNYDIYAQRLNASGAAVWTAAGVPVCAAVGEQFYSNYQSLISDGAGGAIISWMDFRTDPQGHVYVQRINASGSAQWTTNGVIVNNVSGSQGNESLVPDGTGGVICFWNRYGASNQQLFAQRINGAGAQVWSAGGVLIGTDYTNWRATAGSNGSAILVWNTSLTGLNIRAQKILAANGLPAWSSSGILVCGRSDAQQGPEMVSNGNGGVIIAWQDDRNSATTNTDIYAGRVLDNGTLPVALTTFSGKAEGEVVRLNWTTGNEQNNSHFNVQRSTDGVAFETVGRVAAAGNSTTPKEYGFIDVRVRQLNAKAAYYRLEQVDGDNKSQYGKTILIELVPVKWVMTVFPNPAKETVCILLPQNIASATGRLMITDAAGKTIAAQNLTGASVLNIRVGRWTSGLYFVTVTAGKETLSSRFMKE